MTLKLITIDLDETLLRTDKTYDRDRFNRVLKQLREAGVIVAIATGNSYQKIADYFEESVWPDLYFACDNGNYIVKNDQTLKKIGIPYEGFTQIIDFLDEFQAYSPVLGLGDAAYFRDTKGPLFDFISRYAKDVNYIPQFSELPEDSVVTKIAIATQDTLDRNKVLARIINERYQEVTAVTSGDGWVDVYNKEGGKGSALLYLQNKYNIKAEESMAFGDSLNDESMMAQVHYSIAMDNADKDLAMQCRYKIGNNNDQSVICVLEDYIQSFELDFLEKYRTIKE
ncbi:HAD-IIB family hydrolase [Facklamia sp. P12934]|uniref:HAD-IIB family hydrolase n=1 Tax=Facklamia sp. P12934 TaxID=3421948 RepID=UPI003D179FEC